MSLPSYPQVASWRRGHSQADVPEPDREQPDGRGAESGAARGDLRDLLDVRHPHLGGRPLLLHAVQGGNSTDILLFLEQVLWGIF